MHLGLRKGLVLKTMAVVLGLGVAVSVAGAQDLPGVLGKLDALAAKFKSAQADVIWDVVQTEPIPDSDKKMGTVLFARSGSDVEVAIHFKGRNGKPYAQDVVYANGQGKMSGGGEATQTFAAGNNKAALEAFLTLGFGGSGADLQKNWTITLQGNETVSGAKAAKLQLIPKDASIAKSTPKVILWVDLDKGVGVQQQRFDTSGNYSMVTYSNIKMGVNVPSGAFK